MSMKSQSTVISGNKNIDSQVHSYRLYNIREFITNLASLVINYAFVSRKGGKEVCDLTIYLYWYTCFCVSLCMSTCPIAASLRT